MGPTRLPPTPEEEELPRQMNDPKTPEIDSSKYEMWALFNVYVCNEQL